MLLAFSFNATSGSTPFGAVSFILSVSINPGAILFTVILYGPNSSAISLAMPTIPIRILVDNTELANTDFTDPLTILIIRPLPDSFKYGKANLLICATLNKFNSKAFCQAASSKFSNLSNGGPPALFNKISIRPKAAAAFLTKASISSLLLTSIGIATTSLPVCFLISSAVLFNSASSREPIITFAPSADSKVATTLPNPLLAANIIATLLVSFKSILYLNSESSTKNE